MHLPTRELVGHLFYIASIILFIVGIQRMGKVKTAKQGNHLAVAGMAMAVIGQFIVMGSIDPIYIIIGIVAGSLVGAVLGATVKTTGMPEMVALLNGFGALSATLVAIAEYLNHAAKSSWFGETATLGDMSGGNLSGLILILTIIIGASTFTGSLLAFGKLSEAVNKKWKLSQPILLPWRNTINAALTAGALLFGILAVWTVTDATLLAVMIVLVVLLSLVVGVGLVLAIGGGDMPVVISLHASYSGIAGALAGFAVGNMPLIVSGSLVGASGIILTQIMCKAMNRSLVNVVFGGFGAVSTDSGKSDEYANVKSTEPEEAAQIFADARSCIIVPGYGLAVAQAQHACREFGDLLESRGCTVRYAVHPVAGRMPGHMNVLLAEANIPYDKLYEMDAINEDFRNTDVALVIGANDVVNPAALDNPGSPIYGMPILNAMHARTCFVIKRSLGAGFAGIKNELFEKDNTLMIFRDAKKGLEELGKALKEA